LDFLEEYRAECGADGYFIGPDGDLATRLVRARGFRMEAVPALPWAREAWSGKLRAIACLPAAVRAARRILLRERTELVIGVGGFASLGACLAAATLRLPVIIHEANAEPGLANRLLDRVASLVCVGCAETAARFRSPTAVTGVPAAKVSRSRLAAEPVWRFLVMGGSEGSPLLNREAPRLLSELRRRGIACRVRHLAGQGDRTSIERAYASAGVTARVDGFVDNMLPLYAATDLAVSSAGARTLAEIAAAGLPSLLVPLPGAADNHQCANARWYRAHTTAGPIVEDSSGWTGAAAYIETLFHDPQELRRVGDCAGNWAQPDAARNLVRACERALAASGGTQTPASPPIIPNEQNSQRNQGGPTAG
jgi:UDP-N-acetylglucosamine--N-acetylmuramyl-(pentapeptide) pyrophosphoryl-undecaprenol N-acetylglucosamine transferase